MREEKENRTTEKNRGWCLYRERARAATQNQQQPPQTTTSPRAAPPSMPGNLLLLSPHFFLACCEVAACKMIIHSACNTNSWADRDLVSFGSSIGPTCVLGRVSAQFIWVKSWPNFCFGPISTQLIQVESRPSLCFRARLDPINFGSRHAAHFFVGDSLDSIHFGSKRNPTLLWVWSGISSPLGQSLP